MYGLFYGRDSHKGVTVRLEHTGVELTVEACAGFGLRSETFLTQLSLSLYRPKSTSNRHLHVFEKFGDDRQTNLFFGVIEERRADREEPGCVPGIDPRISANVARGSQGGNSFELQSVLSTRVCDNKLELKVTAVVLAAPVRCRNR